MTTRRDSAGGNRALGYLAPAIVGVAAVFVGLPTAGLAVTSTGLSSARSSAVMQFTPANADPATARRVAARIAARGQELRFTPAGADGSRLRTVTVAIRVDENTARAIQVRSAIAAAGAGLGSEPGLAGTSLATIAPTRFNLGAARGYKSFAQAPAPAAPSGLGVANFALPDLASFRPREGAPDRPSRLEGNLALETANRAGRSPRTLESAGEQAVDLSAGYRLSKNLNVTAGVRLSQNRDRIAPLTDAQKDDQAVYVGTQFRF